MATPAWDPAATTFPPLAELPAIPNAPKHAAWFWGADDNLGRLNLLTPPRVKAAAASIRTGEMARVDLPLHVPSPPAFRRQAFQHEIIPLVPGAAYDDAYSLNTQSGTQWDGFRHVSHAESQTFYNFTTGADIVGPRANDRCSIHHWSTHGFAGRGVLLDYRAWAASQGIRYAAATRHAISYEALAAVGQAQGLDIRPAAAGGDMQVGDVLFVRSGFVEDYYTQSGAENARIAARPLVLEGAGSAHAEEGGDPLANQFWAGVEQSSAVRDWLHDCYFAAVAGDSPTFEAFPPTRGGAAGDEPWETSSLHAHLLALWGMPLGEMLDLEKVAEIARRERRWTFFFTSAPANVHGGVASHVNGTAIF